jgi:hypothetical protein
MAFIAGPPKLLPWRPGEGIALDVIMQDGRPRAWCSLLDSAERTAVLAARTCAVPE